MRFARIVFTAVALPYLLLGVLFIAAFAKTLHT